MSKLDDFNSGGKPLSKGEVIDFDGQCQRCFVYIDEAEYFYIEKLLKWKCPEGHISYIEEFRL